MWVKHILIQLYIHWAFIILFIKIKPFPSQVQHCMLDQALQEENYNIFFFTDKLNYSNQYIMILTAPYVSKINQMCLLYGTRV